MKISFAQKFFHYDTSTQIVVRKISVEEYRNNKHFQYQNAVEPTISLWDRFWFWFWFNISQLLSTQKGRNTFWTIFIIIGIAAIAFLIYKITGMDRKKMFANTNNALHYNVYDEDIHAINFDKAIQDAVAKNNYRLAVRLLYLQTLKLLADKNIIQWRADKTNAMYVQDLNGTAKQNSFLQLTLIFDKAWYGNNNLQEDEYNATNNSFKKFQQTI